MNFEKFYRYVAVLIAVIALIVGFVVFSFMPEKVPIHWNARGEIDSFGPKWVSAFLSPAIMLFVLGLFFLIPRIAVFQKNLQEFRKQYWLFAAVLQLFFLAFFTATLSPIAGINFNMSVFMLFAVGALFVFIGLLMPSFKRNFFVGIRTPWTLASEEVWNKTHAIGGKAFILAGIAFFLIAFLPSEYFVFAIVVFVVLIAVFLFAYSCWLYRKMGKPEL